MDRPPLIAALYSIAALSVMASGSHALMAQSTAGPEARATDTAQLLITIDQLVEQNRKLEQQNRQLIDQINALRKVLAAQLPPPAEANPPDGKTVRTVAVTASIPAAAPAPPPRTRCRRRCPRPLPASRQSTAPPKSTSGIGHRCGQPEPERRRLQRGGIEWFAGAVWGMESRRGLYRRQNQVRSVGS